jgi:hypothetical protein
LGSRLSRIATTYGAAARAYTIMSSVLVMKADAFIIAIAWAILFLALRYPWLMLLAAAIWETGIIYHHHHTSNLGSQIRWLHHHVARSRGPPNAKKMRPTT